MTSRHQHNASDDNPVRKQVSRVAWRLFAAVKEPYRASRAALWRYTHRNFLAIFNYHRVTDTFDPQIHLRGTWTNTDHFEEQILYLQHKFKLVRLHDGLTRLADGSLDGACVALTFDDGDACLESVVVPLLSRHGCPATFLINSAYLNCRRLHWPYVYRYLANSPCENERSLITDTIRENFDRLRHTEAPEVYNQVREPIEDLSEHIHDVDRLFVTEAFLRSLDPELFSVGLHGHQHQRFSMMSYEWQREAIEMDIELLSHLPAYRPIFAVPNGKPRDWNDDTVKICNQHGLFFLTCCDGLNLEKSIDYKRISADGRNAATLMQREMIAR